MQKPMKFDVNISWRSYFVQIVLVIKMFTLMTCRDWMMLVTTCDNVISVHAVEITSWNFAFHSMVTTTNTSNLVLSKHICICTKWIVVFQYFCILLANSKESPYQCVRLPRIWWTSMSISIEVCWQYIKTYWELLRQRQCFPFVLILFSCILSLYVIYHLKPKWQYYHSVSSLWWVSWFLHRQWLR